MLCCDGTSPPAPSADEMARVRAAAAELYPAARLAAAALPVRTVGVQVVVVTERRRMGMG